MDFLVETTFRPLRGAPPQIFIRARDWPSLVSAHQNGDEGPLPPPQKKTFDREKLKFGLRFSVLVPHFGASGGILTTRRVMNFGPQTKTL